MTDPTNKALVEEVAQAIDPGAFAEDDFYEQRHRRRAKAKRAARRAIAVMNRTGGKAT